MRSWFNEHPEKPRRYKDYYCVVLGCGNHNRDGYLDGSNIFFHRFPKHPYHRLKWILATGRQYWEPESSSRICSAHFKSRSLIQKLDGTKYVRRGALPVLNVFAYDYDTEESISHSNENGELNISTYCQFNKKNLIKEVVKVDDDDDIICIEPSPEKKPIISNTSGENNAPKQSMVENATTVKEMKKKRPLEFKNVSNKTDITDVEFQTFANNIAAQLRTFPLDVALHLQTEIHQLVVKERTDLYHRMSKNDNCNVPKNL